MPYKPLSATRPRAPKPIITSPYDWKWRQVSLAYRRDYPLCEVCLAEGRVTEATAVHHKIPIIEAPHRKYDISNFQSICQSHHSHITATSQKQ